MPKMKTHRGAAKRFKITAHGKVKRPQAYKSHLLSKKNRKRKRRLRKTVVLSQVEQKRIKAVLPYC